jgi:nucleoside-diphosphate-sugar epimerase
MTKRVLVLGGSGRFGRHATQAFEAAGWHVRQFNRNQDDLEVAMQGANVVVMGWNPPGYHLWERQLVALHTQVAEAARKAGATVLLPGNVYTFGPDAPSPWTAETPHLARNPLGRLRIAAEDAYRAAGTRTIILRCGDFIDGENSGNWFESHIAKSAHKGFIRYPGDPTVPHAWAYLPDAARAAVALCEQRDRLNRFEDVPFSGYTLSGEDLAAAISRAIGIKVTTRSFNWGLMRLLRPFVPVIGGLFEMRYLWSLPHELDGQRLAALLPDFKPTKIEDALSAALAHQSRPGEAFS